MKPRGIVVLLSGSGTNFQAIINAYQKGDIDQPICAVISNNSEAKGLLRASKIGIPAITLDHRSFPDRKTYDWHLQELIDKFNPKLIVLAGFMRILSPEFVQHYEGRMINIHPALLPEFRGLHTHERAIESGVKRHGATVHFVTSELDDGPNIIQSGLDMEPADTPESLASRVLILEHQIYPLSIEWFLKDRIMMKENQCFMDDQLLPNSGYVWKDDNV